MKLWEEHHEMTIKEIAAELGMKPKGVKSVLRRAMKKLRDGRAEKFRDLMIAQAKERKGGLVSLPDRISQTMVNGK